MKNRGDVKIKNFDDNKLFTIHLENINFSRSKSFFSVLLSYHHYAFNYDMHTYVSVKQLDKVECTLEVNSLKTILNTIDLCYRNIS